VTLAISEEAGDNGVLTGYFVGGEISIGKFSGSDPAHLEVRYPFQDDLRASGHVMSISRSASTLIGELRDRHIDAAADDCNFDLARLELSRSVDGDAPGRLAHLAGQYEAQMARSHALAVAQSSGYDAALPYFEKALALADIHLSKDSDQITSYIVGLATGYIWLERFDKFNELFDTRIVAIQDEAVRSVFSEFRVRTLIGAGRAAVRREEFDQALKNFEQANKLQPRNREAIAAIMSVHMRSGRYTEAISFLEHSELLLKDDAARKDIRAATAMVLFKKAQKDDKDGNGPDAEKDLERATELDPGSVYYLIALARMRHKAGKPADAEALLEQGLARFSDLQSQNELRTAMEKIHLTEMMLKKIRKAGN
jgi:tetratricopeptide (TPR) repeat protein